MSAAAFHGDVLTVIPCRMGSTRIPRKNLQLLGGLSLLAHAVRAAIGTVVVVTDEPEVENLRKHLVDHALERRAEVLGAPAALLGPLADISHVTAWALHLLERRDRREYPIIVTLQPAVPARSGRLVEQCVGLLQSLPSLGGALTFARAHPWLWRDTGATLASWWRAEIRYPRSQSIGATLVEINSVQVTRRQHVLACRRWAPPLAAVLLPAWAATYDIDTPADLAQARAHWIYADPWWQQHQDLPWIIRSVSHEPLPYEEATP